MNETHAAAVTPTLHIGAGLPYAHLAARTVGEAVAAVDAGAIAVVPTPELALEVLAALGADPAAARRQVDRAVHGLGSAEAPRPHDPKHPKDAHHDR